VIAVVTLVIATATIETAMHNWNEATKVELQIDIKRLEMEREVHDKIMKEITT